VKHRKKSTPTLEKLEGVLYTILLEERKEEVNNISHVILLLLIILEDGTKRDDILF